MASTTSGDPLTMYVTKNQKVLYITPAAAAGEPAEVARLREAGADVKVLLRPSIPGDKITEQTGTFGVVVSVGASAEGHQTDFLFELFRVLKPSGILVLREPLRMGGAKEGTSLRTEKEVQSALVISGFTSITMNSTQADPSAGIATVEIKASKPNWEIGAAAALSLPTTAPNASANVWSLSTDDTIDEDIPAIKPATVGTAWRIDADDGELIEDESLLEKEDLAKPDKVFDCGTSASGKRKACKNCSCGLAEELEAGDGKQLKKKTPEQASACGNCYLGDAFRCASCPYIGLPAFKPGEKISITNLE